MDNRFGAPAPIFRVTDLRASVAYYVDRLGFTVDWDAGGMVSVSRDRCSVLLTEWDQGQRGTWVWVGVKDAAALHEELVARGARVRCPPTNYYWGYEMQVEDLDGNVLRLGSDPRKDEPFGSFLDASGVSWPPEAGSANGS
jgi:catechol 2,3-dioxygenase-like lactoylglutathione lyase family enzyme